MNPDNLKEVISLLERAKLILNKELSDNLKSDYNKLIYSKLCFLINDTSILIDEINNPKKMDKINRLCRGN